MPIKLLLVMLLLTGCSCKNKSSAPTEEKLAPSVQLKSTVRYSYRITNAAATRFEVEDKSIENKNTSDISMLYEVAPPDSNGNVPVKITFEKFHTVIKKQDQETEIDTDNPTGATPVDRFIEGIKGSTVEVKLNNKHQLVSDEGIKKFTQGLLNKIAVSGADTKQKLQVELSKMLGESFLKNTLELGTGILPDTAVYVGDSWTRKSAMESAGLKMNAETKYTLNSIRDSVAEIESEADVHNNGTIDAGVLGMEANANLTGKQSGEYEVDMRTGLLINEESSSTIKGEVEVMGRKVPITIKMKRKVEGKRM